MSNPIVNVDNATELAEIISNRYLRNLPISSRQRYEQMGWSGLLTNALVKTFDTLSNLGTERVPFDTFYNQFQNIAKYYRVPVSYDMLKNTLYYMYHGSPIFSFSNYSSGQETNSNNSTGNNNSIGNNNSTENNNSSDNLVNQFINNLNNILNRRMSGKMRNIYGYYLGIGRKKEKKRRL